MHALKDKVSQKLSNIFADSASQSASPRYSLANSPKVYFLPFFLPCREPLIDFSWDEFSVFYSQRILCEKPKRCLIFIFNFESCRPGYIQILGRQFLRISHLVVVNLEMRMRKRSLNHVLQNMETGKTKLRQWSRVAKTRTLRYVFLPK